MSVSTAIWWTETGIKKNLMKRAHNSKEWVVEDTS